MTIQSATARVSFACNSVSTIFPVPIQAYLPTDFLVIATNAGLGTETTLTLNSDYTLVPSGTLAPTAWTLTTQTGQLPSPYVTGYTLQVILNPTQTQITQYVQGQAFPSLAVQTNIDRLTQMIIRQQDLESRSIQAPDGDVNPLMILPPAASRANLAPLFDANGNLVMGIIPTTVLTQSIFNTFLSAAPPPQLFFPQTAAEIAAGVTPVNFQYPPGNVLRYGNNTVPGTTDMSSAFQAAFNQQTFGGAPVYIPTGQYLVTSTVATTSASPFLMYGDGMGKTAINKTGDSDLFAITNSGSAFNLITIRDLLITTPIAMASGSAFNISASLLLPSLTATNVAVVCGGSNNFNFAWKLTNCGEASFTRCFVYTTSGAGQGWNLNATQAATTYSFVDCSIYGTLFGVVTQNTSNPGIEGLEFTGCNFVCATGVAASNSQFPTYVPPQITWTGGHINASQLNFNLRGYTQILITGATLYNTGNSEFIGLTDCGDVNITGNVFEVISANAPFAVTFAGTQAFNAGIVNSNIFRSGAGGAFIHLFEPSLTNNLSISSNQITGGASMMTVNAGTIQSTVILQNNTPLDAIDISDSSLTFAATMTLVGIRSDYCLLTPPGGATTCTALTSRSAWDKVTLTCASANATLQHNATNPDGFLLAGAANYTFPASGGRIHLEKRNGGYWTEIARD